MLVFDKSFQESGSSSAEAKILKEKELFKTRICLVKNNEHKIDIKLLLKKINYNFCLIFIVIS